MESCHGGSSSTCHLQNVFSRHQAALNISVTMLTSRSDSSTPLVTRLVNTDSTLLTLAFKVVIFVIVFFIEEIINDDDDALHVKHFPMLGVRTKL